MSFHSGIVVRQIGDAMAMEIDAELERARRKFPTNQHMLAALQEECGELAQALIDHEYKNGDPAQIRREAVQVACMAIRVATEGDSSFKYKAEP